MLTNLTKQENQSMEDYLRSIKMVADSLASIRAPILDLDLIQYTVAGLPVEYESLITVITFVPGSISFDDLRGKLLVYEQRIKILRDRESGTAHQAFAATTRSAAGGGQVVSNMASSPSATNGGAQQGRQGGGRGGNRGGRSRRGGRGNRHGGYGRGGCGQY